MSRPVVEADASLVPDPAHWTRDGVTFRLVRQDPDGLPHEADLRAVHDVLEGAFADHFNSREETFDDFVHRLRLDPGHRWDHWWLAELGPVPVGALAGSQLETPQRQRRLLRRLRRCPGGRAWPRRRQGVVNTIISDAAVRGRDRVGWRWTRDSPTGAEGLYAADGLAYDVAHRVLAP